jgi:hypothetical protein
MEGAALSAPNIWDTTARVPPSCVCAERVQKSALFSINYQLS